MNRPLSSIMSPLVSGAAVLIVVLNAGPGWPQTSRAPFDAVETGLGYSAVAPSGSDIQDLWEPGAGADVWASTPFYAGDARLGARYLYNRGRAGAAPDFNSLYLYVGWSYPVRLTQWLAVHPGGTVGGNLMIFDTEGGAGFRYETEAAAEIGLRLGIRVRGRWRIYAAAAWQTMFTYRRIEQGLYSFGLSRGFDAPDWLRGFLD